MNKKPLSISEECLEALASYRWPGNVRELANCLERAVILSDGDELSVDAILITETVAGGPTLDELPDLSGSLSEVSRRAAGRAESLKIRNVLKENDGDRALAAKQLQITGKTLLAKMREYGLVES